MDHSPVTLDAVVSYARGYMADTSLLHYIPYFKVPLLLFAWLFCETLGLGRSGAWA